MVPLSGLPIPQQVGLLVIDFATRRRMRINGELFEYGDAGLAVSVQQAYGNCPPYIQQRVLAVEDTITAAHQSAVTFGAARSADDQRLVQRADTFFLGTSHPDEAATHPPPRTVRRVSFASTHRPRSPERGR